MARKYRMFFHPMYKNCMRCIDMYKIPIHLGTCIISKITKDTSYWTVLEHYGISREDLKKLNLSYEELYEIYTIIKQHEQVRDFLKNLKGKIALLTNDNLPK